MQSVPHTRQRKVGDQQQYFGTRARDPHQVKSIVSMRGNNELALVQFKDTWQPSSDLSIKEVPDLVKEYHRTHSGVGFHRSNRTKPSLPGLCTEISSDEDVVPTGMTRTGQRRRAQQAPNPARDKNHMSHRSAVCSRQPNCCRLLPVTAKRTLRASADAIPLLVMITQRAQPARPAHALCTWTLGCTSWRRDHYAIDNFVLP